MADAKEKRATHHLLRGRYGGIVSKEDLSEAAGKDPQCAAFAREMVKQMDRIADGEVEWAKVRSEFKVAREKMERARAKLNRQRLAAYSKACAAYSDREKRKCELMRELRARRVQVIREKLNIGMHEFANPISLPVNKRMQLSRMKRELRRSGEGTTEAAGSDASLTKT